MHGLDNEVRLVVKHTFLQFEFLDNDSALPKMERHQSEPLLPCVKLSSPTAATYKCLPSSTPTTCLSLNDDESSVTSLSPFASEFGDDAGSEVPWCCGIWPIYDSADNKTTLMFRNLNKQLTQTGLVEQLIAMGCGALFDFVYMPMNFRESGNFGYAFVNFISHSAAVEVMTHIQVCDAPSSEKWICTWSTCQGLNANVDRYRNSPLMHHSVPEECKPAMYDCTGAQVLFPRPTKNIPKPRIHWTGPKKTEVCLRADALSRPQPRRSKKRTW